MSAEDRLSAGVRIELSGRPLKLLCFELNLFNIKLPKFNIKLKTIFAMQDRFGIYLRIFHVRKPFTYRGWLCSVRSSEPFFLTCANRFFKVGYKSIVEISLFFAVRYLCATYMCYLFYISIA